MLRWAYTTIVLGCLVFASCSSEEGEELSLNPTMNCKACFEYNNSTEDSVFVIGDFNNWNKEGYRLNLNTATNKLELSVPLGGGDYAYRFVVGDEEVLDSSNPLTTYDRNNTEQSWLIQPDCTIPALQVASIKNADNEFEASIQFVAADGGVECDPDSIEIQIEPETEYKYSYDTNSNVILLSVSAEKGKYVFSVTAKDKSGTSTETLRLPFWLAETKFNWSDAIVYQIVTDRFRKGSGDLTSDAAITYRMGGDFAGIVDAIKDGYFKRLAVNTLWISPAYTNVDGLWQGFDGREYESYHGYWPIAPREVDQRWGGYDSLKELVKTAHSNQMRVILDVVPNHVHKEHPYFTDNRYDWFNYPQGDCICGRECSWGTDIETCWFTDYLPDLDLRKSNVMKTMVDDSLWWLTEFNLDGLRVDAVAMMPRSVTRYMRHRADILAAYGGEHVYLIGETFTGANGRPTIRQSLGPYGLSAQFDFPLMWSIRSTIAEGNGSMSDLLVEADKSIESWKGSGSVMGMITGNHDVPRILSVANGDDVGDVFSPPEKPDSILPYKKLLLSHAFAFSQPGAPIIYYGDEYGMPGAGDPDNRRAMIFEDDWNQYETWLAERVSMLSMIRHEVSAMRYGTRIDLVKEKDVIVFALQDNESTTIMALSRAETAQHVSFDNEIGTAIVGGNYYKDCFGSIIKTDNNKVSFVMEPVSMVLITESEVCDEIEQTLGTNFLQ